MVSLEFKTSDKISTFAVTAFAHTKDMNTAVIRRDMLVTLPVKVSVAEPQFLYSGDKYVLRASVSNISSSIADGLMRLEVYGSEDYEGTEPLSVSETQVTVSAGDSVPVSFDVVKPIGYVEESHVPQDVVGLSQADVGSINTVGEATEDDLENNVYNKTNWETGDIISASRLNKVENALEFLVAKECITESELNNKKLVSSNTIKRIEVVSSLPEVEEDDVLYIVR
jgi:hypothetical protein